MKALFNLVGCFFGIFRIVEVVKKDNYFVLLIDVNGDAETISFFFNKEEEKMEAICSYIPNTTYKFKLNLDFLSLMEYLGEEHRKEGDKPIE